MPPFVAPQFTWASLTVNLCLVPKLTSTALKRFPCPANPICQFRPKADIQRLNMLLRSQPALPPFAATAKIGDRRTHSVRTKRPFARAANAGAAIARTCGKFIAAVRPTSPKQPLKPVIRCQIQIALSPRRDRTSRSRAFPTVGRISSKACIRIEPFQK